MVDACRNDPRSDNSRARSTVQLESVTRPQQTPPPGGVMAFFSCSEGERAFEHADLKHGVFFHYVIEGLNGNATGEGSEGVTMPELELYVKKQVHDFVRAKYGSRQMPELRGDSRGLVPIVTLDRAMLAYKRGKALGRSRADPRGPDRLQRGAAAEPGAGPGLLRARHPPRQFGRSHRGCG